MAASVFRTLTPPSFSSAQRRHSTDIAAQPPSPSSLNIPMSYGRRDSSTSAQTVPISKANSRSSLWKTTSLATAVDNKHIKWQTGNWASKQCSENDKGRDALKHRKRSGMPQLKLLGRKDIRESVDPAAAVGEEPEEDEDCNDIEILPSPNDTCDNFQIEWFNSETDYAQKKSEDKMPKSPSSCHPLHNHRMESPTELVEEEPAPECVVGDDEGIIKKRGILKRLSLKSGLMNRRRSRSKSDPQASSDPVPSLPPAVPLVNDTPEEPQSPRKDQSKRMSLLPTFRRRADPVRPPVERRPSFSTNFGYASA